MRKNLLKNEIRVTFFRLGYSFRAFGINFKLLIIINRLVQIIRRTEDEL